MPAPNWKQDSRPKRGGWAPGSYLCKCHSGCGETFIGDKRAMECADCAYARPEPVELPPPKIAVLELAEAELVRLKARERDLLETNNRYLARARAAEDLLKMHGHALPPA